MRMLEGSPTRLGAHWDGSGVNFALFSAHAARVELCLFDAAGVMETARFDLPAYTDEVWHGFLEGAGPGTVYGYRVHGKWAPAQGHRFNPAKLLLDPYARAHVGGFVLGPAVYDYRFEGGDTGVPDGRDSAGSMPKCVVAGPQAPVPRLTPSVPWDRTVLYEAHLRGLTMLHPAITEGARGTYAGMEGTALAHVAGLGVTGLELLPVHAFLDEPALVDRGLRNFWGYNSIGFFAPERRYARQPALAADEFRAMVVRVHAAGLELILDVVYNHTAEGPVEGPCLSFKGIDNASYYRQRDGAYVNDTGCGNTVNLDHPRVLQMVMDSLRYWTMEMGVDGFRFDLAPVLGRTVRGFEADAGFFQACRQDPVLAEVKLIAEAWDIGPGGYQVGAFPPGWAEWNDAYRDDVRGFWAGEKGLVGRLAARMSGSAEPFHRRGRRPWAGVNFVAVHDGFTLRDVVSYAGKHNEANGEGNRDGTDRNHGWNHGTEGPTDDAAIEAARGQTMRGLLATLLLSQGTPMLLAGDEFGRSQGGNNNAYCQDNAVGWVDWAWPAAGLEQVAFVRDLVRLRDAYPVLRQARFFDGVVRDGVRDVDWIHPRGTPMTGADWADRELACLGMLLDGRAGAPASPTVLVIVNAGPAVRFGLPVCTHGAGWRMVLDTAAPPSELVDAVEMAERAVVLVERTGC